MDVAARRELNNGFGDALARSFEFAITPMIFAAIGFAIDRALDTSVLFTIVLLVFGLVGVLIRWFYDYEHKISLVEAKRDERRKATPLSAPVVNKPIVDNGGLPTGVTLDSVLDNGIGSTPRTGLGQR
jgi:hypothetical protein